MRLFDLQEKRGVAVAEMRAIADKASAAARDLTADEGKRFDELKAELGALDVRVGRAQVLADAERRAHGEPIGGSGDNRFDTLCKDFKLSRAMLAHDPSVDAGREREISQEMEKRTGRKSRGIMLPDNIFVERRAGQIAGDDTKGGYVVGDMYRPDQLIDRLRAASALSALGVTVLNGLSGRVLIPEVTGSATVQWVAENSEPDESNLTFGQVALTPKTAAAQVAYSRSMLINASPAIEGLIRNDLAKSVAEAIDVAAVNGVGISDPQGLLQRSSFTPVSLGTNGGAPTIDAMIDVTGAVDSANALSGTLAWLTNPKFVKTVAKIKDGEGRMLLLDKLPTSLLGYPLVRTTSVPSNLAKSGGSNLSAAIFGDWSSMILGLYSGLDLLSNPYSRAGSGQVLVHAFQDVDIGIRHIESFSGFVDAITT